MYSLRWDKKSRGIKLIKSGDGDIPPIVRPVFYEELDLLGFDKYWNYPRVNEPILWCVGRTYFYNGEKVATVSCDGFYTKPTVQVFEKQIDLDPVDVDKMVKVNKEIIEHITHNTLDFIYSMYSTYRNRVDKIVVAFSGGKDSTVLLDLVQRVLPPDEYVAVFNDTTMELKSTYEFIEKEIKNRYPNLCILTAKYDRPAIEMWKIVGIPSRIHRWCCRVYKTAPTVKLIKELTKSNNPKILLYDGVRGDESFQRSGLSVVSRGKHLQQINVHPIFDWSLAEIYLYIFMRRLPLNKLYRYGLTRIGCAVCPYGSKWKETLLWIAFKDEIEPYLAILEDYARAIGCKNGKEIRDFISSGAWKIRAGGNKNLNVKESVNIVNANGKVTISIDPVQKSWFEWAKALGDIIIDKRNSSGIITVNKTNYQFKWVNRDKRLQLQFLTEIKNNDILLLIKNISYKSAYCIGCKVCEVECPSSAITVSDDDVSICEQKCIHCHRCLTFIERGCIIADSHKVSMMVRSVGNIARYRTFGMRKDWLKYLFQDPINWQEKLGPIQKISMRLWLTDSEILEAKKSGNSLSIIGSILAQIGADDLFTWAVIWTNLARNSPLIEWYVSELSWGTTYSLKDLRTALRDKHKDKAERTIRNAISELVQLFDYTPLGTELGLGIPVKRGRATVAIEKKGVPVEPSLKLRPLSILYSLYRYAERIGRYNLTVSEIYESNIPESPYRLFGIPRPKLESVLRSLEEKYGKEWIDVVIVADLDNISLNPEKKSKDVARLYLEEVK